jgi:hypothetical protein
MNIVKQSTGNVVLTDNSGNILKVFIQVNALDVVSSNEIIVKFGFNQWTSLFADQIDNTQVQPNAAIPFNGNAYQLASLLSSSFFFELSGGSQDLEDVLTIGNSAGALSIDLNNNDLLNTDKIDFNLATTDTAGVGQLVWNNTDGTLDLGLQGGLKNKLGKQLVVKARNTSGSLIAKGSVVKVVGVAGGFVGINLAQADNDTNSATAFGIVAEDIADTSNGFVTINGIIHGLNTNAFTEGDILYLSPTVAGEITNVKPVSPAHIVVVGYVAKKSATDGHILLHVQNGYELDELHNVTINPLTLANNDALIYESSTQLWKNKKQPIEIQAAASDETTALTAGTAKVTFRLPTAFTLTGVRASLTTAQTSGSIFTVDINLGGVSVLSTKLTIDNTEKTSVTAVTAPVISNTTMTDDGEITVDIDQIGNGTAKGLKITLIGTR